MRRGRIGRVGDIGIHRVVRRDLRRVIIITVAGTQAMRVYNDSDKSGRSYTDCDIIQKDGEKYYIYDGEKVIV